MKLKNLFRKKVSKPTTKPFQPQDIKKQAEMTMKAGQMLLNQQLAEMMK